MLSELKHKHKAAICRIGLTASLLTMVGLAAFVALSRLGI